jgi:hypothetical protein
MRLMRSNVASMLVIGAANSLILAAASLAQTPPCQQISADRFAWNFSFGNGFEGTNLVGNDLYVMVYYPGSTAVQQAPKPQ